MAVASESGGGIRPTTYTPPKTAPKKKDSPTTENTPPTPSGDNGGTAPVNNDSPTTPVRDDNGTPPSSPPAPRDKNDANFDPEQKERREFRTNLAAFQRNFDLFDTGSNEDSDGIVSQEDFAAVKEGYDEEKLTQSLSDRGLEGRALEREKQRFESAADYFSSDKGQEGFDRLDAEGGTDGKIKRDELDKALAVIKERAIDERLAKGIIPGQASPEAVARALKKFDTNRELTSALNADDNLSNYTRAEQQALAQLSQENKYGAGVKIEEALENTIKNADHIRDLRGAGIQQLINGNVDLSEDSAESQKLDQLADEAVRRRFDRRIQGRDGNDDVANIGDLLKQDFRALAVNNPALAPFIQDHVQRGDGVIKNWAGEILEANLPERTGRQLPPSRRPSVEDRGEELFGSTFSDFSVEF